MLYSNGAFPAVPSAVSSPFAPPLQVTSRLPVMLQTGASGVVKVASHSVSQPCASVTVITYDPAPRPVNDPVA